MGKRKREGRRAVGKKEGGGGGGGGGGVIREHVKNVEGPGPSTLL